MKMKKKKTSLNIDGQSSRPFSIKDNNIFDKSEKNNNASAENEEPNNIKNLEEENFYDINLFKYINLFITKCCLNNSNKYFKYCDLRKEIISEDFLY